MKWLSTTLVLLFLVTGTGRAEPPGRGGPPIERLAAELQLDDHQKEEFKRILKEQRAKMDAERERSWSSGERPRPEQMRERMQKMDQEVLQQLQSVLTAEQIEKYKKLQEERRGRMRDRGPPPFED